MGTTDAKKKAREPMGSLNVRFTAAQLAALRAEAEREGRTSGELVRWLVVVALKKRKVLP